MTSVSLLEIRRLKTKAAGTRDFVGFMVKLFAGGLLFMLQSFLRERLFFRSLVSVVALLSCFFCPLSAYAQDLLSDVNGDGVVKIAAFGDSVTRGTGDYNSVGAYILNALNPSGEAGYPLRVERLLGVPVANLGQVGESCSDTGIYRSRFKNRECEYRLLDYETERFS